MDHNLEDSLNLESAMGVDFDHTEDVVVSQSDISLDTSGHDEGIPMEFENIAEQPMLMDTGNEEIIDFMGDQFTLQEYSVQDDQITGATTTVEANETMLASQSESMLDLQFESEPIHVPASGTIASIKPLNEGPKIISVKAAVPQVKKDMVVLSKTAPRQVPIAPKPPKLQKFYQGKQFAIAPKPVTLVANKNLSLVKKVAVPGGGTKVLAQIGKQLIMVPAGSSQKLKLVTSAAGVPTVRVVGSGDTDQSQSAQIISGTQPPKLTKVIVQATGQQGGESSQPSVITKLMRSAPGSNQTRYVMQQKTIPITLGKQVLIGSPTKHGVKFTKKQQILSIKPPAPGKLVPISQAASGNKTVVVSANSAQNVVLQATTAPKVTQLLKTDASGQRTQLHQINVPGKGIQYIRLVTNPGTQKPVVKSPAAGAKTFVLTDSKGNLIQMTAEKMTSGQPPPLIVTGNLNTTNKTAKPLQKLVRIAPITAKTTQANIQARSGQSLLAPMSPVPESPAFEEAADVDVLEGAAAEDHGDTPLDDTPDIEEHLDSKEALRVLIADAVSDGDVSVTRDRDQSDLPQSSEQEDSSSMEATRTENHPLIVIPSFMKQGMVAHDENSNQDDRRMINIEVEAYNPYQSPQTPQALSDSDVVPSGLRPRKACNCTKSQCLKLYCDCFANGEFCNRCNCINCHNNLKNEELRQKAIRGCLDRNPNAFRPKIGKSKSGGPEIVRRHNKGCNCKRSGCLKNYCECYEAKIACTAICKCVGCRNVEETLERARRRDPPRDEPRRSLAEPPVGNRQPCSFMTSEVIEAVCQCLIAASVESDEGVENSERDVDPVCDVIEEFARCLQDIISASHQATPLSQLDEAQA